MKLLFDLSAAQSDKGIANHGGGEYAKAVFNKLVETYSDEMSVCYDGNNMLDDSLLGLIKKHSVVTLKTIDAASLAAFLIENNIRVFYTALPRKEFLPLFKLQSDIFKVIITIHGLRQLELPTDSYEWYYCNSLRSRVKYIYKNIFKSIYEKSVRQHYGKLLMASRIISVSNASKESLLRLFPILDKDKISIFYSPILNYSSGNISFRDNNFALTKRKYFIILSGSIWTKNSYRAIKAFDRIISEYPEWSDYKMIITGVRNSRFRILNKGNFVITDYLDREILEDLIRNSYALVYPTLNEGFGYPPLEAMKYGIPVLASSTGPIPEVCGEAAYYTDPLCLKNISAGLINLLKTKDLFSDEKSKIRLERYNKIRSRQEDDLEQMVRMLFDT